MRLVRGSDRGAGMRRRHAIVGLALVLLLVAPGPGVRGRHLRGERSGTVGIGPVATLAPKVPAGASRLGAVPSSQPLTITIALRPSHADRLSSLLHDLYDPTSPRYEQWLAPGEFIDEFGPSRGADRPRSRRGCTTRACTTRACRAWPSMRAAMRRPSPVRSACRSPDTGSASTVNRLRRVRGAAGSARHRRRHHEHRRAVRHGPAPQLARHRAEPDHTRGAHRQRAPRLAAASTAVHDRARLRRQQVLDARSDQQLLRRQQPARGRTDRQGEDDRVGRVRAERRHRHQQLPRLLRAPQQRVGRARQRRVAHRPERHGRSRDRHSRSRDPGAGRVDRVVRGAQHRGRRVRPVQPDRHATTRRRSCRRAGAIASPTSRPPATSSTRWRRCSSRRPRRARACSPRAATPARRAATTAATSADE